MLQRWSRICWKWSIFWKACNKQNTWECWMCTGCNQQRLVTDSVRTRSWSGDSRHDCVWDLRQDLGMKCVVAKSFLLPEEKEHLAAVGNDLIQTSTKEPDFLMKVITLKGDWDITVQCTMFLVSCIFSNCLYFSYYMAGYFMDRTICRFYTFWFFFLENPNTSGFHRNFNY